LFARGIRNIKIHINYAYPAASDFSFSYSPGVLFLRTVASSIYRHIAGELVADVVATAFGVACHVSW
jgi:hypothetical protein